MDYEKDIILPGRRAGFITVDADGEIDIVARSGYEDITVQIELEELEAILVQARAHKANYDAFIANDYEDLL